MFEKINGNAYRSEAGYVVEFQKVDGEKAALVGKEENGKEVRLLFIVSAEDISRKSLLEHLDDNMNSYLEKYVK